MQDKDKSPVDPSNPLSPFTWKFVSVPCCSSRLGNSLKHHNKTVCMIYGNMEISWILCKVLFCLTLIFFVRSIYIWRHNTQYIIANYPFRMHKGNHSRQSPIASNRVRYFLICNLNWRNNHFVITWQKCWVFFSTWIDLTCWSDKFLRIFDQQFSSIHFSSLLEGFDIALNQWFNISEYTNNYFMNIQCVSL